LTVFKPIKGKVIICALDGLVLLVYSMNNLTHVYRIKHKIFEKRSCWTLTTVAVIGHLPIYSSAIRQNSLYSRYI